jgi:IS5 family transposase
VDLARALAALQAHGLDRFKVWRSGNKAPTEAIRRELRRRSAIEPVIGHMKNDGLLDRNFLKGKDGDRINAILSGAGHNFRLLLKWLRLLLSLILETMWAISRERQSLIGAA